MAMKIPGGKLPSAHHGASRPHLRARHLSLKSNGAYGTLKGGAGASAFGDPTGGGAAFGAPPPGGSGAPSGGMPAGSSAPAPAPLPGGE